MRLNINVICGCTVTDDYIDATYWQNELMHKCIYKRMNEWYNKYIMQIFDTLFIINSVGWMGHIYT